MAKARPIAPDVETFLAGLKHPRKADLVALRAAILAVSPKVSEGIKWNSPSFRTTEWFATVNLHGKDSMRLILHRGARTRAGTLAVHDPAGLLQWLGKDRAMVVFKADDDVHKRLKALKSVLRHWIKHV